MSLVATQITDRLAVMAATITTANGYTSNVGASVNVADLRGIGTQAPALFIIPSRQRPTRSYAFAQYEREYQIKAFADLRDHPSLSDHALVDTVIWDVRQCFETHDTALMALADQVSTDDDQPGYSEDGGSIVGASITLPIHYRVDPTDPDTAL
jgi:hypothetical protein